MPDTAVKRWVSGGNVPGRWGMWGAMGPFVVVEISKGNVAVRMRPNFLARLLSVVPLIADPGSGLIVTTAPVRGAWWWFVRFQLPGERRFSFEVTVAQRDEILSSLGDAGFEAP